MDFRFTRRSVLGLIAGAGTVTALGVSPFRVSAQPQEDRGTRRYFFLTADEAAMLTALCDRIIPKDEFPSASEAGAIDYIDLQLATAWGKGAGLYLAGPHQTDAPVHFGYQLPDTPAQLYRRALAGLANGDVPAFVRQSPDQLDDMLRRLEKSDLSPGGVPGRTFFGMLRQNTMEGYFADPIYNGNRDYAGWRMIGFPGADAYYLTEIDRYNMPYLRPPGGIAARLNTDARPFTPQTVPAPQLPQFGG